MGKLQPTGRLSFVRMLPLLLTLVVTACNNPGSQKHNKHIFMKEKQISFSAKNHALDNNDNFSPDDSFLCYDTRGTVLNFDLANCQSIEKIGIFTGEETVLYAPESVTGEQGAPGVAAVSYHPCEEKVIFIHGPLLVEVAERGFYGIRNRSGAEVSADGKGVLTKVDMRDVATNRPTTPGAQRGGTHRHEYTRNGNFIGFTYDDFLQQDYDRTIGYMIPSPEAPQGYTHYFAVLVKPVKKGTSKPGEIEKAYGDSWVDADGKMRAFVGQVRSENGVDYQNDLFVAEIPESVKIGSAYSGDADHYPEPPKGVTVRRLTHNGGVSGVVRGSFDGKKIAFLMNDEEGVAQVNIIDARGSDLEKNSLLQPKQVTRFESDAAFLRWHPNDEWIFSVVNGNIAASCVREGEDFGKTVMLTNDQQLRSQLVVSRNGEMLAYNIDVPGATETGEERAFMQIFVMELDQERLNAGIN
ncbi:DUF3748 domain-containing protein [Maribellus sp. YY47]|uniref:DUF3748 domain-containing protein n=1 Tax=Maribellus sp. YY47 TaxID=2929486 RepID=UPI0020018C83|nr:DUF3748 domain-containing protein [Maribellus sp. YY47]MCK3682823.1 DUF3748 domain-containing protein [Maribellus sp. YY47]